MSYVKGIFGNIYHNAFTLVEGQVITVEDAICKTAALLELEAKGIIKIFDDYEKAVAFKFRGYSALALESLPHLNPPTDEKGNQLPLASPFPTMNLSTGEPIKKEYNYITEPTPAPVKVVLDLPVVPMASDSPKVVNVAPTDTAVETTK